jgi:glycosyltransferase involved in cell wall biosynthesis|tara:strand:- start:1178 stop:2248 length:1071 start_codon:yes stop_codon:yes gene_type:complete
MEKIIFLVPYPVGSAPSQRFRFEQYLSFLEKEFEIEIHPFIDQETWKKLYVPGQFGFKARKMLGSFARRLALLPKLAKADHIFIHREATQIGPPIIEWILAKVLRKKYIYDFDDAIWIPNFSETNARFQRLKAYWKVPFIIRWAGQVTAGNRFLSTYASKFNKNVIVLPTTIDTENHHNILSKPEQKPLRIGWTGTHTTMHYLDELLPVLERLNKKHEYLFRLISNQAPDWKLPNLEFIKWKKETEIQDLAEIQIGVMPLKEDRWSAAKCGFKGLQYMACAIPTVLSPVGVNLTIVKDNENGFFAKTEEDWFNLLDELLTDESKRKQIAMNGRQRIIDAYSVLSQEKIYRNLFQKK